MTKKKDEEVKEKIEPVVAIYSGERILADNSGLAKDIYDNSRYGEIIQDKIQYSIVETLYLLEKGKLIVREKRKQLNAKELTNKAKRLEPNFWVRYVVYKDIRDRGYIIKTALKFGADFRVYERGVKPGEDHAKWVVFPVNENKVMTWHDFAAKNRVAHSTRKRLLLAVVDDEGDVSYWESRWIRP